METKVMDAQAVETARKESRKLVIWTSDDFTNEEAMREWWDEDFTEKDAVAVALKLGIYGRELTEEQRHALEVLAPVFSQAKKEKGPDDEAWYAWQELICDYLDDQKSNLNKDSGGTIIAFEEYPFRPGVTRIEAEIVGHYVNEILTCEDGDDYESAEWYGQDGEICRNVRGWRTVYRIADYRDAETICNMVNEDRFSFADALKMTDSLYPVVAGIYGWD